MSCSKLPSCHVALSHAGHVSMSYVTAVTGLSNTSEEELLTFVGYVSVGNQHQRPQAAAMGLTAQLSCCCWSCDHSSTCNRSSSRRRSEARGAREAHKLCELGEEWALWTWLPALQERRSSGQFLRVISKGLETSLCYSISCRARLSPLSCIMQEAIAAL